MAALYLDTESFSSYDLKRYGTEVHCRNGKVILLSWCWEEGPVSLWEEGDDPDEINEALAEADRVIAHNAFFDRTLMRHDPIWYCPPLDVWHCTMAQALSHGLPGSLDALGRWLNIPEELRKKKEGSDKLIQLFCKPQPRTGRRLTKVEKPEEWKKFRRYAKFDTAALRENHKRLPRLNLHECA